MQSLLKFKDKLDFILGAFYAKRGPTDHVGWCVSMRLMIIHGIRQVLKFISCPFNYKMQNKVTIGGGGEKSQPEEDFISLPDCFRRKIWLKCEKRYG